jgi:xyloglucan-specific endo-beta-1,4-glucanase
MKVYSFVASGTLNSFSADVKDFFKYLESNKNYPSSSQNLIGMIWMPVMRYINKQS